MPRVIAQPNPAGAHDCDHPGCSDSGDFRAPKSRADIETYFWFCLRHVREYNRAWNFFTGMSRDEIVAYQHSSNTWHRPTWAIGVNAAAGARVVYTINSARDDLGAFSQSAEPRRSGSWQTNHIDGADGPIRTAFAVLALRPGATGREIKRRYYELAMRHHPDRNGGSEDAEEQLKKINEAYTSLTTAGYVSSRTAS